MNQEDVEVEILRLPHRLQELRKLLDFFMIETNSLQVMANQLNFLPEDDCNYVVLSKYPNFKDDRLVERNLRLEINRFLDPFNMVIDDENPFNVGMEAPRVILENCFKQLQDDDDWRNFLNESFNEMVMLRSSSSLLINREREQNVGVDRINGNRNSRLASIPESSNEDQQDEEIMGNNSNGRGSEEVQNFNLNQENSEEDGAQDNNAGSHQLLSQVLSKGEQILDDNSQGIVEMVEKKIPVLGKLIKGYEKYERAKGFLNGVRESSVELGKKTISGIAESASAPSVLNTTDWGEIEDINSKNNEATVSNSDSLEEVELPVVQATEVDELIPMTFEQHQFNSRRRAFDQSHIPNLAGRFNRREVEEGSKENQVHQKRLLLGELINEGIQLLELRTQVDLNQNASSQDERSEEFRLLSNLKESLSKIKKIYSSLENDDVRLEIWEYDQKFNKYLWILREEVRVSSPEIYEQAISDLRERLIDVSRESENFDESSQMRRQTTIRGSFDQTNYRISIARSWLDKPIFKRVTTEIVTFPNTVSGRLINLNFKANEDEDAKRDMVDEDGKEFDTGRDEREAARLEFIDRGIQRELQEKVEEIRPMMMLNHRSKILTNVLYDLYLANVPLGAELLDVDVRIFDPNLECNLSNMDIYSEVQGLRKMLLLLIYYSGKLNNTSAYNMLTNTFFSDAYMIDDSEEVQSFEPGRHVRKSDLAYDRFVYLGNTLRKYVEENGGTDEFLEDSKRDKNIFESFLILKLDLVKFNQIYDRKLSELDLDFNSNFFRDNWLEHQRMLKELTMSLRPEMNLINRGETPGFINDLITRRRIKESQDMSRRILEETDLMLREEQASRATTPRERPDLRPGLSSVAQHFLSNTPSQVMRTVDEASGSRSTTTAVSDFIEDFPSNGSRIEFRSSISELLSDVRDDRSSKRVEFRTSMSDDQQQFLSAVLDDHLNQPDNPAFAIEEETALLVNSDGPDLRQIVAPSSHDIDHSLSDDHGLDVVGL